jgi:hypothetical protein
MTDFVQNDGYPLDDVRRWLTEAELRIYTATQCEDLASSYRVQVRLKEYEGKRQPHPSKYTDKQAERLKVAGRMLDDFASACNPNVTQVLLEKIAALRWMLGGSPKPADTCRQEQP